MRPADTIVLLPHAPPMRLVEEVVELTPGVSATSRRRAAAGDFYFDGHFPGEPVVPAVILIELVAQTGGLAAGAGQSDAAEPVPLRLAAVGGFKFPKGCGSDVTLETTVRVVGRMGTLWKIEGEVTADGQRVAIGSLTLAGLGRPPARVVPDVDG